MGKLADDRHALYVGAVLTLAWKNGVDASVELDEDGNYTDTLVINLGDRVKLTLVVPPPPVDWVLGEWEVG
jgi:hypothetical protein